jgi:hypothetical protein
MNTVDTTKLWTLVPGTDNTWSEIVGAGGICMDVFEATTEQAQEICDMLNGPTRAGACSVTYQTGDQEVTYSAPHADEAMWMAERGEQRQESGPVNITLNVAGVTQQEAGDLADFAQATEKMMASGITPVPPTEYDYVSDRREGKSTYAHIVMIQNLQKQVADLSQALDSVKGELEKAAHEADCWKSVAAARAIDRDGLAQQLRRATEEGNGWKDSAAYFDRAQNFYRGLVDRCAVALGQEAFTADDGVTGDSPIRLKVPELVENLVEGRSHLRMVGERGLFVYGTDESVKEVRMMEERIKELKAITSTCMGVGGGDGQLFVYGNHESIKAAQAIALRVGDLTHTNRKLHQELENALKSRLPALPAMEKAPVMAVSASDGYFLRFVFDDRRELRHAHEEWIRFCQAAQVKP